LISCGGCNPEELQIASETANKIHTTIDAGSPMALAQPYYIYVMLGADIATSALAAWLALSKRQTVAEKSKENGNN